MLVAYYAAGSCGSSSIPNCLIITICLRNVMVGVITFLSSTLFRSLTTVTYHISRLSPT